MEVGRTVQGLNVPIQGQRLAETGDGRSFLLTVLGLLGGQRATNHVGTHVLVVDGNIGREKPVIIGFPCICFLLNTTTLLVRKRGYYFGQFGYYMNYINPFTAMFLCPN